MYNAENALASGAGYVNCKVDTKNFRIGACINMKAEVDVATSEVKVLGNRFVGHKPGLMSGTITGKILYNIPNLRRALTSYKSTGLYPKIEITIVNDDPSAIAGKQSVTLKGCVLNKFVLAMLDAEGDTLQEDINGTFNDYTINTAFAEKAENIKAI